MDHETTSDPLTAESTYIVMAHLQKLAKCTSMPITTNEACTRVWVIWVLILSSACPWNVPSNGSARLLRHYCDSWQDSKYHIMMT